MEEEENGNVLACCITSLMGKTCAYISNLSLTYFSSSAAEYGLCQPKSFVITCISLVLGWISDFKYIYILLTGIVICGVFSFVCQGTVCTEI